MLNLPIPKEMESRISQFSQQSFVGSSVIGNAKKTLCVYSADLHLWICKATHLFCNASSCSCASFLHLLRKNLPVFRVGKWAMFPRNACVACRALVGFESRVCDCLNHLINLDRQHWETSNLHDNQQCIQPAGCLFPFHQIFSPSVKINVIQFRLIFCAWRTKADGRTVSRSRVDVVSNKWTWLVIFMPLVFKLFAYYSCLRVEKSSVLNFIMICVPCTHS